MIKVVRALGEEGEHDDDNDGVVCTMLVPVCDASRLIRVSMNRPLGVLRTSVDVGSVTAVVGEVVGFQWMPVRRDMEGEDVISGDWG